MCLLRVMTFDLFFTLNFEAIIDFNLWQMISSVFGINLGKCLLDCFHIAHTYASAGVDVPFGGVMILIIFFYFLF